jgi:hypothetical protein
MPKQDWTTVGGGYNRVVTHHPDGSTRETTERRDGGLTIVDTSPDGTKAIGEGVPGWCGLSDAGRLNQPPKSK